MELGGVQIAPVLVRQQSRRRARGPSGDHVGEEAVSCVHRKQAAVLGQNAHLLEPLLELWRGPQAEQPAAGIGCRESSWTGSRA